MAAGGRSLVAYLVGLAEVITAAAPGAYVDRVVFPVSDVISLSPLAGLCVASVCLLVGWRGNMRSKGTVALVTGING